MQTIWNGGTLQLCDVTACKSEARQPLGKTISLNNFDVAQNCLPKFTACMSCGEGGRPAFPLTL